VNVHAEADVGVRVYRDTDEARVLGLLGASLGGGPAGVRAPASFRWKHFENPFGDSLMLLAEADDRLVGLRAFMRWRCTRGDRDLTAVRAVDTATHPEFQGRGIFSRLTLAALATLRGEVDLVFNTPNEKSLPGYLKMGWRVVGVVPIRVRIRRPFRLARHARSLRNHVSTAGAGPPRRVMAPPASEALRDPEALSLLLERTDSFPGRLSSPRTVDYLRWRYGSAPLLDYRAVGDADAVAIFRVRPRGALWETTVSELIVPEGDVLAARRALRTVARVADTDHLTFSFPPGSTADRAVRRSTFRVPGGMTLVANPLAPDLEPDPTLLSSWALSLGDLEVF
jgi:GNAT superfamily N-acetyltransferase